LTTQISTPPFPIF